MHPNVLEVPDRLHQHGLEYLFHLFAEGVQSLDLLRYICPSDYPLTLDPILGIHSQYLWARKSSPVFVVVLMTKHILDALGLTSIGYGEEGEVRLGY